MRPRRPKTNRVRYYSPVSSSPNWIPGACSVHCRFASKIVSPPISPEIANFRF